MDTTRSKISIVIFVFSLCTVQYFAPNTPRSGVGIWEKVSDRGGDFGQKILAGGRGRGNFYAKKLPNINSYDIDQEADLKHFKVQKYTFFGSRNSIWGPKRGSKCQIGQISQIQAKLG